MTFLQFPRLLESADALIIQEILFLSLITLVYPPIQNYEPEFSPTCFQVWIEGAWIDDGFQVNDRPQQPLIMTPMGRSIKTWNM